MADSSAVLIWEKIQPTVTGNDIAQALRCEVHDPLWLLARQWQTGEFNAEDAGMAAFAHVISVNTPVQRFLAAGDTAATAYNANDQPLNAVTERVAPVFDLSMRIEAGCMWRKMLVAAGKTQAWTAFLNNSLLQFKMPLLQFDPDNSTITAFSNESYEQLYAAMTNGRMIDGGILYNELQTRKASDFLSQADQAVNDVGNRWLQWVSGTLGIKTDNRGSSWDAGRLEYHAITAAALPGGSVAYLDMPEYQGHEMDAFSWQQTAEQLPLKSGIDASVINIQRDNYMPAAVSFPGMPRARWWEFEDSTIDLSNLKAHKTELGLLLLSEFGLVYSNDWLTVPLKLPTGCLASIRSMRLTDVFGVQTYINASPQNDSWELFNLTTKTTPAPKGWIYLPAVSNNYLEGPELEEIHFIRDEMANMVWGVETIVPDGTGEGIEGYNAAQVTETWLAALAGGVTSAPALPDIGSAFNYEIGTTVRPNWIPFIPLRLSDTDPTIVFRRAAMPRFIGEKAPTRIRARTAILQNKTDAKGHYDIQENEIPASGLTVTQQWRRTRWIDGSIVTWLARQKTIGRDTGRSGLQFDILRKV
jgi:hypothetical protein